MIKGKGLVVVSGILILGLLVFLATKFNPTKSTPQPIIRLVRSVCFGSCPAYQVTIYEDGKVIWQGEKFVKVEGERTTQIPVDQVNELIQAFEQADFFSMRDYQSYDVTDNPSATVSVRLNGRAKTVSHYYGDESAPVELFELECKIDEVVNTNHWIGHEQVFCREWIEFLTK